MKKPPSASVKPPTQTTQRVPMRSSKPGPGRDAGAAVGTSGIGGGATGGAGGAACWIVSVLLSLAADGATGASCKGSGGGTALVAAADDAKLSIRSSRARNAAV